MRRYLTAALLLISLLVVIWSACTNVAENRTADNNTIASVITTDNHIDDQRYLLKWDNGVNAHAHTLYDPRGITISYYPPVTPFKINKVFIRGYRKDFEGVDNKTYTLKIWDRDFVKELYSQDYPYTKFSTKATLVEHKIQPPLIVTDNFTVDFITHSESPTEGDKPKVAIYTSYDDTLGSNEHIGVSWLGTNDSKYLEHMVLDYPAIAHACWIIQVEGTGQAIGGSPPKEIVSPYSTDTNVIADYYLSFPCVAIHPQVKEARNLISQAMARRSSLAAEAYGTLIGSERDQMYKAIDILEQCVEPVKEGYCSTDDRRTTLSSIYNDIGFCHTFLKNENIASDYYAKALFVNPSNKVAASNKQSLKGLLAANNIVQFNLSR